MTEVRPHDGTVTHPILPLGRACVGVEGDAHGWQLIPSRAQLPCVARDGRKTLFELPEKTIPKPGTTTDHAATRTREEGSLSSHAPAAMTDDGGTDYLNGMRCFVEHHIERCNELAFPSQTGISGAHSRVHGLTRREWADAGPTYWNAAGDGPLRLIVRIARECADPLRAVCEHPRQVLRRERRVTRLERVQQVDAACVRWLSRQPGRTTSEKAGPRRRVLAVERSESADTPENRVIRDFLERIAAACAGYMRDQRQATASVRHDAVQRFRTLAGRLLTRTEIGALPRIAGLPSPNYVLQFDPRYAPLWTWYERLRRQQESIDQAMIWRRRVLVEHVRLAIAQSLTASSRAPHSASRVYVRPDHDRGMFLHAGSLLGPWSLESGRVDLIENSELPLAAELGLVPTEALGLAPDLALLGRGGLITLVFAQFAPEDGSLLEHERDAVSLGADAGRLLSRPGTGVLVVVGKVGGSETPEYYAIGPQATSRCVLATLPVPPTPHSWDLRGAMRASGVPC